MSLRTEAELVGKVLDLTDVVIIRCRACLPPMKGVWLISRSPIPVFASDQTRLGFALTRLVRQRFGVDVEMFLAGDTPERLDLELGRKLYVRPWEFMPLYQGKDIEEKTSYQLRSLMVSARKGLHGALIETGPVIQDDE